MKQQLETIRQLALKAIEEAEDQQGLENLRVKYLGKRRTYRYFKANG